MAIVEIDTLQRIRDMTYDNGGTDTQFRVARIASVEVSGQSYLLMSGEISGLASALIEPNGGLSFIDAYATSTANLLGAATLGAGFTTHPSVASFEKNGQSFAFVGSTVDLYGTSGRIEQFDALSTIRIEDGGTPVFVSHKKVTDVPGGGGTVSSFGSDPQIAKVGSRDILINPSRANSSTENEFETFAIKDSGKLKPLAVSQPFTYDFAKFDTVSVGKSTFVVAMGQFNVAPLQVLRLKWDGTMEQKFELPTSDTAIFNRITTDLETVEIGDRSFVLVSEVTNGSILVYEIDKTGRLTLVEQETPGRFDGWSSSEAIEVFEENGNHYAAAGGYGNGIGVFEISDGGALTEVDEFTYSDGGIRFTYDLDVRDLADGRQYIFASTATQDEVRSFRFIAEDNAIATGKKRGNGTDEDDQIFGTKGNNILKGREGDDMIEGGAGDDRILGEDGQDNLFGGDGRDALLGGEDYDFLFGDAGRDRLLGGNGNDVAYGGSGNDRLFGEAGNDRLFGDGGRDRLDGGDGLDVLTDGKGLDILTGGTGNDRFVFWKDGVTDTITDYEDNRDTIDLTEFGRGLEFSDLAIRQAGTAVEIDVMGETIIVNSATGQISDFELSLGDFVFAI